MEARLVTYHSLVPQLLDDDNYETWRSFMEDYLLGRDLWDVVTQPKPDENTAIATSKSLKNMIKSWTKKNALAVHAIKMSCGPKFLSLVVNTKSSKEAWDMLAYVSGFDSNAVEKIVEGRRNENQTDYSPFIKAIREEKQEVMKMFIELHPEALSATVFPGGGTALHCALFSGKKEMATWLVELMKEDDLEILDKEGYTALVRAAALDYPGVLDLLQSMIAKNSWLPNIRGYGWLPVNVASSRGNKNSARFLYNSTDKSVFNPEWGHEGVKLLILCINIQTFDMAIDLVRKFPHILLHQLSDEVNPIRALATRFPVFYRERELPQSRYDQKTIHNHYHDFLNLVCAEVSTFDIPKLMKRVYPAIIDATKKGNAKFINEMIRANHDSLYAHDDENKSMFWHAVENRQEEIFSLIYEAAKLRDHLLSGFDCRTGNNILHLAAKSPDPIVLDRISSNPVLQLQREVLWFKEVWDLADPCNYESLNYDGLTPRQLFSRSHVDMFAAGERLIKETATASTVVGALILTIMFAAAFTVPGGNNQDTGYPIFANKILFKLFIICDVFSLSSSATSILVFLTFLTNSHVGEDFLFDLPKRLMIGVLTLFFSIATMMMTFCLALALMLNGRLQLILPLAFITSIPVFLFSKSMFPLLSKIYHSTFGSSIFERYSVPRLDQASSTGTPNDRRLGIGLH